MTEEWRYLAERMALLLLVALLVDVMLYAIVLYVIRHEVGGPRLARFRAWVKRLP